MRYDKNNWIRQITECGYEFIDIDDLVARYKTISPIYLEISNAPCDAFGVDKFLSEMLAKNKTSFILHKTESEEHQTKEPSLHKIRNLIEYFSKCT